MFPFSIFLLAAAYLTLHNKLWNKTNKFALSSDNLNIAHDHILPDLIPVRGNCSKINENHPVVSAIVGRWKEKSLPGARSDNIRIGLAIEGGGMRGCVAAGATAALNFLGLNDCFDSVYGSSAGSMIGAYFISRQFSGVSIYHDILPAAGSQFISKIMLLKSIGMLPRIYKKAHYFRDGSLKKLERCVIDIDLLLSGVMGHLLPLDWETFSENEKKQPLRIITSNLSNLKSRSLSRELGNYKNLQELLACIRSSMLVPGICSGLMAVSHSISTPFLVPNSFFHRSESSLVLDKLDYLVDGFLCEPMPFRTAVQDGCTHVVQLRTRPDPCLGLNKRPGIYERVIAKRFLESHRQQKGAQFIATLQHQRQYAQDIMLLNDACEGQAEGVYVEFVGDVAGGARAHLLPLAPGVDCVEIGQLENRRSHILRGMRDGARRVLSLFGPALGVIQTNQELEDTVTCIFPESILNRRITLDFKYPLVLLEDGVLIK